MEFIEKSRFNAAGTNAQGLAFDGTYFYQNNSTTLRKYDMSGDLIATRDCSSDGSTHTIIGSPVVVGGVIYVPTNNYTTDTPKTSFVLEYNASDLSYRNVEHNLGTSEWITAIGHDGSNFWVITDPENSVWRFDAGFTNKAVVPCNFQHYGGTRGIQGLAWVEGDLFVNLHEGSSPRTVQRFAYDSGELRLKACYTRPLYCTQGMVWANERMYFGTRGYGEPDAIVETELLPYDGRFETVIYATDGGARTTSETDYVEQTDLSVTVAARKGDLIKVDMQGLFKVSANSLRAGIGLASDSLNQAIEAVIAPTLRSQCTNAEMETKSLRRLFVASEDGEFKFNMYWRQNVGGTATCLDRSMTAQVVGRAGK